MEQVHIEELRIAQLNFIGRIVANFTHELKNHLAIIKESAGLQLDLITFERKSSAETAPMVQFLKSVDDEVKKSIQLITFLNRYAHRLDDELSTFSPNEALEELLALTDRLAYRKKISLVRAFHEGLPSLYNSPARLQLLLFHLIEEQMHRIDGGGGVTVGTAPKEDALLISVIPDGSLRTDAEAAPLCSGVLLGLLLGSLHATLTYGGKNGGAELTISSLPQADAA